MKTRKRTASKFTTATDKRGRRIVRLDVGYGKTAKLVAADWARVQQHFGPTWYLTDNGRGRTYVAAQRPGNAGVITLARVVADASPGERVRYRDGDRLNLLPENLDVIAGPSKRAALA